MCSYRYTHRRTLPARAPLGIVLLGGRTVDQRKAAAIDRLDSHETIRMETGDASPSASHQIPALVTRRWWDAYRASQSGRTPEASSRKAARTSHVGAMLLAIAGIGPHSGWGGVTVRYESPWRRPGGAVLPNRRGRSPAKLVCV